MAWGGGLILKPVLSANQRILAEESNYGGSTGLNSWSLQELRLAAAAAAAGKSTAQVRQRAPSPQSKCASTSYFYNKSRRVLDRIIPPGTDGS